MSGLHADSERPPQTLDERPRTLQEKKVENGGETFETTQDVKAWGVTSNPGSRKSGSTLIYLGLVVGLIVVIFAGAQFWPTDDLAPSERAPAVEQPAGAAN